MFVNSVPQRSRLLSLESCTQSHACRPLSKNISIPLTKECLNCIICQAGRLAKAYSPAPCLRLRLNRAAAFVNVTQSCGVFLPNESTCIYGSSVFIPSVCRRLKYMTCPAAERCPGMLTIVRAPILNKNERGTSRAKSHYLSA